MPATRETVSLRIDRSFETPSVPLVLTRIIQVLDDESSSSRELEQLIMHDPSLSARILRLANSAFYSFRDEVKTISHAIALLGLNLVKSLAIGVNIFESFTRGMKKEAGQVNKLWMHSFGAALIGQEIWARRSNRKEGEFAFLCGLLHDLGKVVFFKCDSAHYAKMFSAEKQLEDPDICALEMESYGMDHAAMGASLAKQWGLPPDLATVIRKHHSPLSLEMPLVAAVSMADMLAKQNKIGYDGDCKISADLAKFQSMLNMGAEEYARLQVFAESKRIDVEEFFLLPS
jgi:HD-like signal output (HDOD) protein